MHVLFVHPNYPAQFRHVAPRLAADFGWDCTFATNNTKTPDLQGVRRVIYRPTCGSTRVTPEPMRAFYNAYGHARGVYDALKKLVDVRPDLVVAHSGFGSSLFLPYLYDAPVVNFFEYFYRPVGQDLGYRPDLSVTEEHLLRSRTRNGMILLDLDNCDRGWCPSHYQREMMPAEYRGKIEVIPEGIDTALWKHEIRSTKHETNPKDRNSNDRNGEARRLPDGTVVADGVRVVTYVSRGFELMRGFDLFMRAAKLIYAQFPDVLFVVVGTDKAFYGSDELHTGAKSLRQHALAQDEYDLSKFRFTGRLSETDLAAVLGLSDLHVYLTEPFVTSWSMLDAMSCGCVLLASDQKCVREYLRHGENGLLCDFFDVEGLARQAVEVLRDPPSFRHLGDAARRTIEQHYSLDVTLPRIEAFFEEVAAKGPRTPSVRAELLVRAGTLSKAKRQGDKETGGQGEERPGLTPDLLVSVSPPLLVSPSPLSPCRLVSFTPHVLSPSPRPLTILFNWELGSGKGHMMQMLPLARALVARGHRVFTALREAADAEDVFAGTGVCYAEAPHYRAGGRPPAFPVTHNFAHLLANVGWHDDRKLFALMCCWGNLYAQIKPDVGFFDHSPTALVAARGLPMKKIVIGSGFCVPPDQSPWPLFRPELAGKVSAERLAKDEGRVLARANRLLTHWGRRPLERLGQLYLQVDETFLTTLPELEQCPLRADAEYWGPVLPERGAEPNWPKGDGQRVFAYLKRFDGLEGLAGMLRYSGRPTVLHVDGLNDAERRRMSGPTLHLETKRVDVRRAAAECDAAVLHAGQGATAAILLAGKPILQIPLVLEQRLTAEATERLGAGAAVNDRSKDVDAARSKLDALMTETRYAEAARRFAQKYSDFDPAWQVGTMVARVEELIETKRRGDKGTAARGRAKVFAG